MRAIVIFDREKLEWNLMQLNLQPDFSMTLKNIKRSFTKLGHARFPHILEVELDSFELTGENTYTWSSSELPKTPTIEECLTENKVNLTNCLNALKQR